MADGRVCIQKGVGRPYFSCFGVARTDSVGKKEIGLVKCMEK